MARPAGAQVLYGSITGTIQDTTGSVVPHALVTVVNSSNGQSRATVTSDAGTYVLPDLAEGSYTVTRLDSELRVGEVADTVTVEATAGIIQTDSADVHVSLGSREVAELPLP